MRIAIHVSGILLAACQPTDRVADNSAAAAANDAVRAGQRPDTPVSSDDPAIIPAPSRAGPTPNCPIVESSGWRAHIDAMPGPNARTRLIVSGRVTVPTGGYRVEWGDFRIAESYPVQIFADLRVVPPSGPATQALVTHDVRGEWPTNQTVGSITIRCGSRVIARISNVGTAH